MSHAATPSAVFNDYASILSLMRTNVAASCDLADPRIADFHVALEVAWTAAMLLVMQAREDEQDMDIVQVA
ncbi:MAG: hypothetical protein WDN76_07100 [Alphaproteobacteria bacterium]